MSGQSGVKVASREARVWGVVALGGSFSKPGWLVSAEFAARRVGGALPSKSPPQFVRMPVRFSLYDCMEAARYEGSLVSALCVVRLTG